MPWPSPQRASGSRLLVTVVIWGVTLAGIAMVIAIAVMLAHQGRPRPSRFINAAIYPLAGPGALYDTLPIGDYHTTALPGRSLPP